MFGATTVLSEPNSPHGGQAITSIGGSGGGGGGVDDDFEEGEGPPQYTEDEILEAFEVPDRFDGMVPSKMTLNDDAWKVVDGLQDKVDRLRNQIRFLGSKPNC